MAEMAKKNNEPVRVIIVGGGVSGLTAAYYLRKKFKEKKPGVHITLLEASGTFGGVIGTNFKQGCLLETGPDCFSADKPAAIELCRDLGIEDELIGTQPVARTFFLSSGDVMKPFPKDFHLFAPARFKALYELPFVDAFGKCRMAMEPFLLPSKQKNDESLGDFFRRRFGHAMVHRIIQPVLGSIFGGNVDRISLLATFPRLREMELQHGSVVKALRAKRSPVKSNGKPPASPFLTLKKGMGFFIESLLNALKEEDLRSFTRVHRIEKNGKWIVHLKDGEELRSDYLCMAASSKIAAALVEDFSPGLSYQLAAIPSKSMISVYYALRKNEHRSLPAGSGFVRLQTGDEKIMGGTFAHLKFDGRSPKGIELIRVFVSPSWCHTLMQMEDQEIGPLVYEELRDILGLSEMPLFFQVSRHDKAMPQYEVGHLDRVQRIENEVAKLDGFFLTGNAYRGVGVPGCIERARTTAEEMEKTILTHLMTDVEVERCK